ncbi:MAG TPA: hypothetical protein VF530_16420 [Planctomycetota bacterium]
MRPRNLVFVLVALGLGLVGLWLARTPGRTGERRAGAVPVVPQARATAETTPAEAQRSPTRGEGAPTSAPESPTGSSRGERETTEPFRLVLLGDVRSEDGRPIEGADLLVGDPWHGQAHLVRSDAGGALRAELVERPYDFVFTVLADGFEGSTKHVDGLRGDELRLGTFHLRPGGEVSGRVLDEAGQGISDAWVEWLRASAFPSDPVAARANGPEEESYDPHSFRSLVLTDAEGAFRVRGLPRGEWFLAASAGGRAHGWTEVFEVGGAPLREQVIVLPPSQQSSTAVSGVVQEPSGQPLPGAVLRIREGKHEWPCATAGREGRFVLDESLHGGLELGASDPEHRFGPVWVSGVAPGTRDLVLRLTPPVWMPVRLVDEQGRAVPWGHVELDGELHPAGREGLVRVLRPERPTRVRALAPGFRTEVFDQLTPPPIGEELRVTLRPGQALRGRVVHAGRPVRGARLNLSRTPPPDALYESRGVAPMDHPFVVPWSVELHGQDGTTDGSGAFLLTIHERGWYGIRVEADGFPLTVLGPFELDPEVGRDGLELALERGGTLEGSVRLPPGAAPEDVLVGVSNGWRFVRSAAVDAEGRYRIEDLAPGPYQVRRCTPPVASLQRLDVASSVEAPEWDCRVRAGETTRFDLDLTQEGSVVLSGRLEGLEGARSGWRALLYTAKSPRDFWFKPRAQAELERDGRFELTLSRPGLYRIELRSGPWSLWRDLELFAGPNEWERRIETGRILLRASGDPAEPHLRYVARAGDGLECVVEYPWWQKQAAEGGLRFDAPVGPGRLETATAEDPDVWTQRREITLEQGQELALDFP